MMVERVDLVDSHRGDLIRPEPGEGVPTTHEVLLELFQLLEDYAPTWYSEKHHNRAVAALLGRPL